MLINYYLSESDLKLFLTSYKDWVLRNPAEQEYVEERFPQAIQYAHDNFLTKSFWDNDKDLIIEALYGYVKELDGQVYRTANKDLLNEKFEDIKKGFFYIIESIDVPLEKAKRIIGGDLKIKGLSRSFWSPILQAAYPEVLPNWNNKTEDFFEKIVISFSDFSDKYAVIAETFSYFKKLDSSLNFSYLNHLMHYGVAVEDGIDYLDELLNRGKVNYWQIATGEGGEKWEEFKGGNIVGIGWDNLGDLKKYKNKEELLMALADKYPKYGAKQSNNANSCDFFANKIKVGDYVFARIGQHEIVGFGKVISDYGFDSARSGYKHIRRVEWLKTGEWTTDFIMQQRSVIMINEEKIEKLKKLIGISQDLNKINNSMNNQPKNLILYGPPGTGKTFSANKMVEELLKDQAKIKTKREQIAAIIKDFSWLDIIGMALLVENRLVKVPELIKTEIVDVYANDVKKRIGGIGQTSWRVLQDNADSASTNIATRNDNNYFHKNDNSEWELTEIGKSIFGSDEYGALLKKIKDAKEETLGWEKFYKFITFHQSYSYEEFVEGIRPVLSGEDGAEALGYKLSKGIFREICEEAKNDKDNEYVLVIDEINRGNISKIFGELITLLEEDKRGKLKVLLPYSKEEFSVPDNLYIIGTMNTADRSIALLDIALRRRFHFKEVMPDASFVKKEIDGVALDKILGRLNEKISIMIDRDHQIGHSYFMKVDNVEDLRSVWYGEIIPLLQEYFYNDWVRLKELLGAGFVKIKTEDEINRIMGSGYSDYSGVQVGEIVNVNTGDLAEKLKAIYE
jgi:DNA polymerase III delta prime subunit